jgi:hypothetical protein
VATDDLADQCVTMDNTLQPTACGGPSTLTDNFDDGVTSAAWVQAGSGGGYAHESNGELIGATTAGAGGGGGYNSTQAFDFRNDAIWVEVTAVPSQNSTAAVQMQAFSHVGRSFIMISELQGQLHFSREVNGSIGDVNAPIPYDPVAHRWWRLRESAGITNWETSPDSVTWTVQASATDAFDMRAMVVSLWVLSAGTDPVGGAGHYDNFNRSATEALCPMSAVPSNLGNWDQYEWVSLSDSGCNTDISGGEASLTLPNTAAADCDITSMHDYDLRGSSATVQVMGVVDPSTAAEQFLQVRLDDLNALEIRLSGGMLHFSALVNGSTVSEAANMAYDASHVWWRIREDAGVSYWESSPDGRNWTTHAGVPDPIDVSRAVLRLGVHSAATVSAPGTAVFTQLNGA